MSALRNMESAISGFVNKVFGRVFRGHVELVELARKLGREMEDHKAVSVARIYVPNEYVVYLSPPDRAHYSSFERAATRELADYLTQRARHDGFTLLSEPVVTFETDEDLRGGEYGIACRVVDPPAGVHGAPPDAGDGAGAPSAQDVPFAPYEPAADLMVGDDGGDEAPLLEATDLSGEIPSVPAAPEADAEAPAVEDAEADDVAAADRDGGDTGPGDVAEAGVPGDDDPFAGRFPASDAAPPADHEEDPSDAAEEDVEKPDPAPPAPVARVKPPHEEAAIAAPAVPPIPPPVAEPKKPAVPPPAYGPRAPDPVAPPPVAKPTPPPVPPVPPAPPIAPAHTNDGLAGVSGTQMMPPAERVDEPFVQEEVSLIIDGRRHRLTKRTTTIGRSRECDISVNDANASRKHAEVRHIGLDYFLVDLGSTNGTYVNQQRIRRHAIANGDRIVVGTTEMIVEHVKVDHR